MSLRSKLASVLGRRKDRLLDPIVCSECFIDRGLLLEAQKLGNRSGQKCPNCGSLTGMKLNRNGVEELFDQFFCRGSFFRTDFGGASRLAANSYRYRERDVEFPPWLEADVHLLEDILKIGLFHYGPPLWQIGEIEPLSELRSKRTRPKAILDIIDKFSHKILQKGESFYRVRKNLASEIEGIHSQYDAPPNNRSTFGRLDSKTLPVLYGSKDLEICIHECRTVIPDECFVATLEASRDFRMLDLVSPPSEPFQTPFESTEIAMRFLFAATDHAYEITRSMARAAKKMGFDGIYYPSYFSLIKENTVENIALFGHPIAQGDIEIKGINRAMLKTAAYEITMGPIFK